jgi:acetyltransferase-like isoleucine patch superfamily enzyme
MVLKKIFNKIKLVFQIISKKFVLIKYNNYTISIYYRKQGAQIGEECYLGIRKFPSEPYLVKIGNKVLIADGTTLITHTSGWNFRDRIPDLHWFGKIEIGDNCYIGAGVIILPNVTIGENCLISAGAVVTKDMPPNSVVAGVPAKVIGNINDLFDKMKSQWVLQKPPGYMSEVIAGKKYNRKELSYINQLPRNKELLRKHLINYFWGESYQK